MLDKLDNNLFKGTGTIFSGGNMNFKNNFLFISLLISIALWHCRNRAEQGGDTLPTKSTLPTGLTVSVRASSTFVAASAILTLTATVGNRGGDSTAATLRWYLSTDRTIDMSDTPAGTDAVGELTPGDSVTVMNAVTAPNIVGTYHYGACAASPSDKSGTSNGCSSAVMVVVVDPGARLPANDFTTLSAAENNEPFGIWSDGATLWAVDITDDKLYAYKMSDRTRDPDKDLTLAAENDAPTGIWSDDTNIWVADFKDNKLYTYALASGDYVPAKDFTLTVGHAPTGIWSDGSTLWVADANDKKLYAYKMSDRTRDPSKDFTTLRDAGNDAPRGIWSDGLTLWVADDDDDKLYAYKMSDGTRDPSKDFTTLRDAGNIHPRGIWSDGSILWVADRDHAKLYAYNARGLVSTTLLNSLLMGLSEVADTE